MKVDFPSSIDPEVKFLDRYTVRDVVGVGVVALLGWSLAGPTGATVGLVLGSVLTAVQPGGNTLHTVLVGGLRRLTTASTVSPPALQEIAEGSVTLSDDSVVGIVRVSMEDVEYLTEPAKQANRDTVAELLQGIDYPIELHSRQRQVDVSDYPGTDGTTVTTDHYVIVKASESTGANRRKQVTDRCIEIRNLLTAGDLYAERLTGSQLDAAVKQMYTGDAAISQGGYETEYGQHRVCRMLYVDEFPDQLPFGWVADVLTTDTPGVVDVVQTVHPISDHQRDWLDRMLARVQTELAAARTPSRQARLREQEHDIEDLIDADAGSETLVNYGVYIVVRGDSDSETEETLAAVRSHLNRLRVDTAEPSRLTHAVKAVSAFQRSRFDKLEIVPGDSAAAGFSFGTTDHIEPNGIKIGQRKTGAPLILDRFSWEAGHITVLGKIGSGKTYWTALSLIRSAETYDDLEIYVIDPKKRDYGDVVDALDGHTVFIDREDVTESPADVVRYTVEDPSRDNSKQLADVVRHVYRQASDSDRKTLVVIDEAHRILTRGNQIYEDGIQAVSTLIRETRQRNVAATLVTQNADEFTRSHEGRNILRNTDCNIFFKQKDVSSDLTKFFNLSDREATELRKLRTGTDLPFSEALVRAPVNTRLRIDAQPAEHRLLEHGDCEDALLESAAPATPAGFDPGEPDENIRRTDGGSPDGEHSISDSEAANGFLTVAKSVLRAPIGLFEYGLLAGFPVTGLFHRNETVGQVLPIHELSLTGSLIDVLAAWTVTLLVGEMGWILLLSTADWLAQFRR